MRKNLLLILAAVLTLQTVSAQVRAPRVEANNAKKAVQASAKRKLYTGFETTSPVEMNGNVNNVSIPFADRTLFETVAGSTNYDLQSNAGNSARMHLWPNGEVTGTWTLSTSDEAAGFTDRGTGINRSTGDDGFDAGTEPTARLESVRTGFPAYVVTADGTEHVFSHIGVTGGYRIRHARRANGATAWTESNLATNTPNGTLWCRAAAGGPDGNTIHLVAYTTPTTFGGVLVDGLDGTIVYSRSTDGGQTWDIVDQHFPYLNDDNLFSTVPVEAYPVSAHGNAVAIALFPQTHSTLLFKSEDNGATWAEPRGVLEFPLINWSYDEGYTWDDIGYLYDESFYPDSMAIMTTDETGYVLVDDNGMAHVFAPSLFVQDPDTLDDDMLNWYPGANVGILYWNESMNDYDNANLIQAGYFVDLNADTLFGNATSEIFTDGYALPAASDMPSASISSSGRIFMSYTAPHDLYIDQNANTHFRQIFMTYADPGDGYTNWATPFPVMTESNHSDPFLLALQEMVYPSMPRYTSDDEVHIMYQQDYTQGLNLVVEGNQTAEQNFMTYIGYEGVTTVGVKNNVAETLNFSVSPNPAHDVVFVQLSELNGKALIEVFDNFGQMVRTITTANTQTAVVMQGLPAGMYNVRVTAENRAGVSKIVKQ